MIAAHRSWLLCGLCLLGACGTRPIAGLPPPIAGPEGGAARSVDFELEGLDGQAVRLADYRGRVVLVNYFATWCAPCYADIQAFTALYDGAPDRLAIIGISLDLNRELVAPYVEMSHIEYPVAFADEAMLNGQTPFGEVHAIPASFLIDSAGRHVETFLGLTPIEHVIRRVEALGQR